MRNPAKTLFRKIISLSPVSSFVYSDIVSPPALVLSRFLIADPVEKGDFILNNEFSKRHATGMIKRGSSVISQCYAICGARQDENAVPETGTIPNPHLVKILTAPGVVMITITTW